MDNTGRINRAVAQLVVEKLDQKAISAADAKSFLYSHYGVRVAGRSREDVANNVLLLLKRQSSGASSANQHNLELGVTA